jgi:hypothetical protein
MAPVYAADRPVVDAGVSTTWIAGRDPQGALAAVVLDDPADARNRQARRGAMFEPG